MKKLATLVATAALIVGILPAASAFALVPEAGATADVDATSVYPIAQNVRHVTQVRGSTGGHVTVEGDRLYMGSYGTGMRIFDVSDPAAPEFLGDWRPGPDQEREDPGLRADAVPDATVMDGRHIVAFGGTSRASSTQQTEFLDVTDPAAPQLLHRFTGASDGEAHNSDIFDREGLWLPSGGRNNDGFRIFDLAPVLDGQAPTAVFRGNPHTMWKDSPVRDRTGAPLGAPFTHTHDVTIYPDHTILLQPWDWVDQDGDGTADPTYDERDIVLLAEGGSYLNDAGNTGSVFIIDITEPSDPVVLNRWVKTPQDGHPIRYYHEAQLLDADPSVMFVSDEDLHNGCEAGGVSTVRLSEDLTEATWLADWFNGTGTPAPNCSAHVFSSEGHYVFMGSYNAGLQVIDLSDPANPTRGGQYIAAGANSWGALAHGGYVYVGDFGARGLDVFKFVPPLGEPVEGQPEACRDHEVDLEDGETLVEHTLYMHGDSPSGNVDAALDDADGVVSRMIMDAQEPEGAENKVFGAPNPAVVSGNRDYYANPLLGFWATQVDDIQRIVCAEAVIYAGTADGVLTLDLWIDNVRIAEASATATPYEVTPYRMNFGPLNNELAWELLAQAVHDAPGSLLYYDSAERPSKLTYVTVERTG